MPLLSAPLFQQAFGLEDVSPSSQQRYEAKLQDYQAREWQLMQQKERLEARQQRISQLKGRYNF
ncbi:hypothetical protein [Cesiribacter andamanensis]|uniref:Uncharacterized protein n=1 Tax=Cesiribacter andamanensis AMV16 TaxID=1279009 RepID=M7NTV2_9BACT|nr:hypothetical protein [Cesiribacter andamanensis]EMR01904.1 hypothetical protein ADICEAN_02973 [Cesiribacter andamanensis AMV16]